MNPPITTIEELIDMEIEQLRALTPDQLDDLFAPALQKQEAIFAVLPAPKSGHVSLGKPTSKSNAVATALLQESMAKYGISADMLAKFGIKTK